MDKKTEQKIAQMEKSIKEFNEEFQKIFNGREFYPGDVYTDEEQEISDKIVNLKNEIENEVNKIRKKMEPQYLDVENSNMSSITISGKELSISKFKSSLLNFISERIDSSSLFDYMYITGNTYTDCLAEYSGFYHYTSYGHSQTGYKEARGIGFGSDAEYINKFYNKIKSCDKIKSEEKGLSKINWEDVYVVLYKDSLGQVNTRMYVYNKTIEPNYLRNNFSLGNTYFSEYNKSFFLKEFNYSLHDKIQITASEYVFRNNKRFDYQFRFEDYISYLTLEYLYMNVNDFKIQNETSDEIFLAIKISDKDDVFSNLNLLREDSELKNKRVYNYSPGSYTLEKEGETQWLYPDDPNNPWQTVRGKPFGKEINISDSISYGIKIGQEDGWSLIMFEDSTKGYIHESIIHEFVDI
jgi:hypothetical protein